MVHVTAISSVLNGTLAVFAAPSTLCRRRQIGRVSPWDASVWRAGDHDTATGDHWDRFFIDLNHLNGEVMPKLWPDNCIHFYCMDALISIAMQLIHPLFLCIAQITAGEDHQHEELIIFQISSSPLLKKAVPIPVMSVILFWNGLKCIY